MIEAASSSGEAGGEVYGPGAGARNGKTPEQGGGRVFIQCAEIGFSSIQVYRIAQGTEKRAICSALEKVRTGLVGPTSDPVAFVVGIKFAIIVIHSESVTGVAACAAGEYEFAGYGEGLAGSEGDRYRVGYGPESPRDENRLCVCVGAIPESGAIGIEV